MHGGPHVLIARRQVPTRRDELIAGDSAAVVDLLSCPRKQIGNHFSPDYIAIALDDDVGAPKLHRFIGIKSGVNTAIHNKSTAFAGHFSQFHTAQRIAGVNADTNHISGFDTVRLEWRQGFIGDEGIAVFCGSRGRQNV